MGNATGKNLRSIFWKATPTTKNIQLETYLLAWLDPNVNTSAENRETQNRLREILTCLVTFDQIDSCENWLKTSNNEKKIVLIVSGAYGERLVPKIHYLPSIISIYVYCLDINRNKSWSANYPKIREVISNTRILLKQLSMNQTNLESVEDFKAFQIYSLDTKLTSYLWYPLLLEILLSPDYLPSDPSAEEFLQLLRAYSSYDECSLDLISQFERTYDRNHTVSWLMSGTFLARFLNKVLRERDINMLFIMRFLLVEIHREIKRHQANSLDAYRLQLMTRLQMESLLRSAGQWLVIDGFLFASTNKPQLISTMTNDEQYETVLVNIKANYRTGIAPFAFVREIDSSIEKQTDREIIFMCGSIFTVDSLVYQDSIWTLQLTLIDDRDIMELAAMKQQLKISHHLSIIGDLLNHCGQSEQAVIYYQRLRSELPKDHFLIPQIEKQLSVSSKSDSSNSQILSSPPVYPRYLLLNLSSHMTELASAMLTTLRSLTCEEISIHNDESSIDFFQWSGQSILLFTTADFAGSLKDLPSSYQVFILQPDNNSEVHQQQHRCATIEDLISRLADEIIRIYRSDAHDYRKTDNFPKAKELAAKADQIYREIFAIQIKFTTKTIPRKTSTNFEPSLISLVPHNEDISALGDYFGDFFSSYYFFFNEHECHQHIVEHEDIEEIFLIILTDHPAENFREFANVKQVYSLGKMTNRNDRIFPSRDDLYYQLTLDLIRYYAELAEEYETNNEWKIARDVFLKGQHLCRFLNDKFFS